MITKIRNKINFKPLVLAAIILLSMAMGFFANRILLISKSELISPFVSLQESISFPLLTYAIPNLKTREFNPSAIVLESLISEENKYDSYLFSYTTLGKKMTGQINIPDKITSSPAQKHSAIIMIRGYVPTEIYTTGMGTKSAAATLANSGHITIAPDFFGFGESDPEPTDSWQTRFEKPIIIIELLKSLELNGVPDDDGKNFKVDSIGIWAHSNGGQIALTVLEILDQEIPTTLWAPVTAPFPYSVLYFGDELEDEGKDQRKWISMFEDKYDAFDFSLTKHLDLLRGPIQIHHGDADDAALIYWSEEFVDKIELENSRRAEIFKAHENSEASEGASKLTDTSESASANKSTDNLSQNLEEIDLTFYKYENTNHNMVPNWNKTINRDLQFFDKYLN